MATSSNETTDPAAEIARLREENIRLRTALEAIRSAVGYSLDYADASPSSDGRTSGTHDE